MFLSFKVGLKANDRAPSISALIFFDLFNHQDPILPDAAAQSAKHMELPGILEIGGQFFIKVDNLAVFLPESVSSLQQAVGYLLMYYYILDLDYPPSLKFVFVFFEMLFNIPPSSDATVVKKLFGDVLYKRSE